MKIPLRIVTGGVYLTAIIFSSAYHTGLAQINFVVDTGSNEEYLPSGSSNIIMTI